ncbi:MAG: ferritin-like domain-containing protein [Terriglobales bacterium]
MPVANARDLFISQLRDIYSAEKQAVRTYPRLAKAADSAALRDAMQEHLEQTRGQLERLDQAFEALNARAGGKTCEGMKALLQEAADLLQQVESGPLLDAALIAALQRVEHYEIAAYGTVATLAGEMGKDGIRDLLDETLQEEKDTDQKLTEIAGEVNSDAFGSQEDESAEQAQDEQSSQHQRGRNRKAA